MLVFLSFLCRGDGVEGGLDTFPSIAYRVGFLCALAKSPWGQMSMGYVPEERGKELGCTDTRIPAAWISNALRDDVQAAFVAERAARYVFSSRDKRCPG